MSQAMPNQYRFVDDDPALRVARQEVRAEALGLIMQREVSHQTGSDEVLPPPVDALSTAEGVLQAAEEFGEDSPEHQERSAGLLLDCNRLLAEWLRKLRPEYFSRLRHIFDDSTEEFLSHGVSSAQMTRNALMPIPEYPEEQARRVNERVEDATPHIARRLGGVATDREVIRTISECTDQAEEEYERDLAEGRRHSGYWGYVPEISKFVVRDISFDTLTNDRFLEQAALPGKFINHFIFQEALRCRNLDASHMDKTALHGAQIIAGDSLLDFVRLLDTVASEQWRTNIFWGEEVPADHLKDYEAFRQEAIERQAGLGDQAHVIANFVTDLARDKVDKGKALEMVEAFVKKLLLDMAKTNLAKTEEMFDERTAELVRKAQAFESQGNYEQAAQMMLEAERVAPGGGFCGASCGIESINPYSDEGKELINKLRAESSDAVVIDKVRKCKCGRGNIAYAYSQTKVNKYCSGCGAFESKKSVVAAKAA